MNVKLKQIEFLMVNRKKKKNDKKIKKKTLKMKSNKKKKEKNVKKCKFTEDEDKKIRAFVKRNGEHNWSKITKKLPNRTPRQCRERWKHYLSTKPIEKNWSSDEDSILLEKKEEFGTSWTKIAEFLPGRTSVNIKNRYALLMRRKKKEEENNSKVLDSNSPENFEFEIKEDKLF